MQIPHSAVLPRLHHPNAACAAAIAIVMALHICSAAFAKAADLASERFTITRDGHELTLPYESSYPLAREDVSHLVVVIHGLHRDVDRYHNAMHQLWEMQNDRTLAIITPQFITQEEVKQHNLDERFPYWTRHGWPIGHRSRSDNPHPRQRRISSFEMLDEMLLAVTSAFPDLQGITIAGHSAGGQFVNRYAASNRAEPQLSQRNIAMRYIVSNPSSYLYFCEHRVICRQAMSFGVLEGDDCTMLNTYRYGLGANANAYLRATGLERIPDLYASRRVLYLLGEQDNDPDGRDLDRGCGAMAQGSHRFERGLIYHQYLAHRFGEEVHTRHHIVTVPDVGHSAARMFRSSQGRAALFEAWS